MTSKALAQHYYKLSNESTKQASQKQAAPEEDVYVTAWIEGGKKPMIFANPVTDVNTTLSKTFGVSFCASKSQLGHNGQTWISAWDRKKGCWVIRDIEQNFIFPSDRTLFIRPSHFEDADCLDLVKHLPHQAFWEKNQSVGESRPNGTTSKIPKVSLEKGGSFNSVQEEMCRDNFPKSQVDLISSEASGTLPDRVPSIPVDVERLERAFTDYENKLVAHGWITPTDSEDYHEDNVEMWGGVFQAQSEEDASSPPKSPLIDPINSNVPPSIPVRRPSPKGKKAKDRSQKAGIWS